MFVILSDKFLKPLFGQSASFQQLFSGRRLSAMLCLLDDPRG